MSTFSKAQLRTIDGILVRVQQDAMLGARALTPEEMVEIAGMRDVLREHIAIAATKIERGKKVIEWRIPTKLAPTQNAMHYMKKWQYADLNKKLDDRLRQIIEATPGATVYGERTRRWVRVTRFSVHPERVDDPGAIDSAGGKLPVDALKRLGVIVDDSPALCHREGLVAKTKRGNTHLFVQVFECADQEVPDPGPYDAPVEQIVRKRGKLTKSIVGEDAKPRPRVKHASTLQASIGGVK